MNEKIKKWVEALRSGKYEQGKGYLHKDGNFCCLGVLCDLAVKDAVGLFVKQHSNGVTYYDCNEAFLPIRVGAWLETPINCGELMRSNDIGESFSEIADFIEEKYLQEVM